MGTAVSYQFRDLLADDLRLLGPDYPDTLTTRGDLAYWQDRRASEGWTGGGLPRRGWEVLSDSGSGTGAARLSELRPGAVTATPTRPATCANLACQALCIALRSVRIEGVRGSNPATLRLADSGREDLGN